MHDVPALYSAIPRRVRVIVCAAVAACTGALAADAESRVLVEEGKARYAMVLPDRPVELHFPTGETLRYAADFLNEYLAKTCGATLSVVQEGDTGDQPRRLYLGPTDFAARHVGDLAALHREELVLRTRGEDLIICGRLTGGKTDEGTLFAVYEFCERVLGVRWYFADDRWSWDKTSAGIRAPKRATVNVPDLDVRDHPAFLQHEGLINHWGIPEELERRWHPVLRFGNVRDQKTPNHTQSSWYNLYHETHPEYFAKTYAGKPMLNPKARGIRNYICFTNPAVLEQMLENIHEWDTKKTSGLFGFTDRRTPDPHTVYFCPNDGLTAARVCKCPACRKRTHLGRSFDGQLSELVWDFIRRYAIAIHARWPGRRLGVLAYSCYQQPPTTVEIPENVDVTLVFRDVIYMHDPEVWDSNMGRFDAWRQLLANRGGRLSLWYNMGTLNCFSYVPAMYPHAFRRMMQHFQKQGAVAHFFCGFNPRLRRRHWPASQRLVTAALYPLFWMQSKIMWNPARSPEPEVLLRQYCDDVYGPAADPMVAYYELLIRRWESTWASASDLTKADFMYGVKFPPSVSDQLKALLAEAESLTEPKTRPYQMVRYVARGLAPSFFKELDTYANAAPQKTPRYFCTVTDQPPVVDGRLDEPVWANQLHFELQRRAWGEPSDRVTRIRLVRDAESLYVGAELDLPEGQTDFAAEELRIQFARSLLKAGEAYAPNIDKAWREFRELRIASDGTVQSYDRLPGQAAAIGDGATLTIEAQVPLASVRPKPDQQVLPVQFMRYWGTWNRYDTWAPAMTRQVHIYPTARFGLVVFLHCVWP